MNALQRLSGIKTHLTAVAGLGYLLATKVFQLFPYHPEVLAGLGFTGLSFLRSGVAKHVAELLDAASAPEQPQPVAIVQPKASPPFAGLVVAAALVISGATAGALLSGCQAPPQRIAYNEASGGQVTLDSLMTAWGDYVRQFHPGTNIEYKVLALYRKARTAELADIDAAHAYANAVSSTNGVIGTVVEAYQSPEGQAAVAEFRDFLTKIGVFDMLKRKAPAAPAFTPLPIQPEQVPPLPTPH